MRAFSRSPSLRYTKVTFFDAVYARALRVPLEKTETTVIALADLIALKRSVGRPRDLEDIAAVESLAEELDEREERPDE